MRRLPHPIPYQGSKRLLAQRIAQYIRHDARVMFEPFAGSAAMTLYAAHHRLAKRFVIGDSLLPIVQLWRLIVEHPRDTAARYRAIWMRQTAANTAYFNEVRARYNREHDPVDLLYLTCRCVKNAVRFNAGGDFTQSADKRRLGAHPDRMQSAIEDASRLLVGKIELRHGDWLQTVVEADARDFVYLDPPYLGTSTGRDKRYHRQLAREDLIDGLAQLRARGVRFALSYDGTTGIKTYGELLPDHLGLSRLLLDAGRSSQATLSGRNERTIESLYLSPDAEHSRERPQARHSGAARSAEPGQIRPERI